MKAFKTLLCAALFLVLAMGCSSTASRENMLTAAGFQAVPANTPDREAHLRSLPADKITAVQRNGTTYYTFPDRNQNVLYVGQEPQYQEYQRLRLQQQMADERVESSEVNNAIQMQIWGGWSNPSWAWQQY